MESDETRRVLSNLLLTIGILSLMTGFYLVSLGPPDYLKPILMLIAGAFLILAGGVVRKRILHNNRLVSSETR
jgi:O-antigen/teichoic acid export membrane protein